MSQYSRKPASGFDETQRLPTTIVILLVVLAVLLIGGGLGLAYLSIIGQMTAHTQATATAQAHAAATFAAATASAAKAATVQAKTKATATAQANVTATAIAATTATAQAVNANATATASVIAANPDPYPPGGGTLALLDPLHDNSQGHNWDTNATNCAFSGGTYHVSAPGTPFFASCAARSTNFSNFIYEVQMTIIKGDVGGMIFRADSTNKTFYLFYITQAGRYALRLCPGITCHDIVPATPSPAINLGLNKPNLVAVVAIGNTITLYVNHQQIASVTDSTFSHGQIGVVASAFVTAGHPTEAVYSNAKVWML